MQDFWETLTAGLPRKPDYRAVYERFEWNLPSRCNIGVDACDKHAGHKNRLAIISDRQDGGVEKWTFWELKRASDRFANALRGIGVERGDRVAVLLSQSPELAVAHIAAYKLGAIAVPLFVLFGEDALEYRLADSGARVLITDDEHFEVVHALRERLPDLEHIVLVDADRPDALAFDDLSRRSSSRFEPVATGPDDPAMIIYTSGTTGPPKGALHGHRVLAGHLPGVSFPHDLMPRAGDLMWTPADWAWGGGLLDVLLPALHWGIPVVAHRMLKFDPERAFGLMERWGVRNTFLPPTALKMMRTVDRPCERWDLELETIASGGEILGEETFAWVRDELGITVNEFYGQTECNLVVSNCAALHPPRPGSAGWPVPGHWVAIIDPEGEVLAPGEQGEVAVRRPDPVMMLGYWNNEEATKKKFVKDWWRMGDLASMSEDGCLTFVGRDDDVISSAGYRIGPSGIEETLVRHSAVVMTAVIGKPDPTRGEIVKAFVVLKDGEQASQRLIGHLQELVKKRLSAHEYPREIEFVDALPMTVTGKIQRNVLRQRETEKAGA